MKRTWPLWAIAVALPFTMLFSLGIGNYPLSFETVWHVFVAPVHVSSTQRAVIELIRMPRIALATVAGMGLGICGAALQGLFRNPLVGPDIVGVSSGAACGGVLAISFGAASAAVVGSAFVGGMMALGVAAGLARAAHRSGFLGIVLAGVLVGAFCSALVGIIEFLADPYSTLPGIVYWLMGSFASADRSKLATLAVASVASGGGVMLLRWRINLLSLGDEDAAAIGLNVNVLRWVIVVLVTLIVAAQVAVSGMIGWVGLIVPHIARVLVGPDHTRLLPASALIGGLFVLLTDDLARTIASQEIPVGLLTAVVGAPMFAVLLWRSQNQAWRSV